MMDLLPNQRKINAGRLNQLRMASNQVCCKSDHGAFFDDKKAAMFDPWWLSLITKRIKLLMGVP